MTHCMPLYGVSPMRIEPMMRTTMKQEVLQHFQAGEQRTMDLLQSVVMPKTGAEKLSGDAKICKVSIVGIGMRSHVGVASKMFSALSQEGINIQMITTSEIKTSVVIDEKYMELAVRALHKAFDLDGPVPDTAAAA